MYKKIPRELKEARCWVNVWNTSKVAMQSTIKRAAASTNPSTWSTFDEAVAAVEQNVYDGIGYVFNDTGIVGIDIDYGFAEAHTTYGKLGVKVWIYAGEVLAEKRTRKEGGNK